VAVKTCTRLLAIVMLASSSTHVPAAASESPDTNRIIIKWRSAPGIAPTARQQHVRALAARLGNPFQHARNLGGRVSVVQLAATQRGRALADTLAALRADPEVELAEVDQRMRALTYTPSDEIYSRFFTYNSGFYNYQWYLKSAQPAAIRANAAWDITHGGASPDASPVVVAVVDTGIRPEHPDLAGKLLPGFDFVSNIAAANDGDGWDADPTDPGDFITLADMQVAPFKGAQCGEGKNHDQEAHSSWHGTHVAGLIGAGTDNGIGMAGAGFNLRIVPVRVLGKCGGYLSDVLAGMYWAAGFFDEDSGLPIPAELLTDPGALRNHRNLHPAQIINLSLGASGKCSGFYATAVREITAVGILVVAAAGNDGSAVYQPANCPGALGVAGLRHSGTKVGYSNLGPEISVAAPAGNCGLVNPGDPCLYGLNSLTNLGLQAPTVDDYTSPLVQPPYGTSYSAPLVAATAGLMKVVNPQLTPALLIARIKATARAFPSTDEVGTTQVCEIPATKPDDPPPCVCNTEVCGAGMLDAGQAVQAALRPAALVQVRRSGNTYVLDGSASGAATGNDRTLTSYAWTVLSVDGGATTPGIVGAAQALASVPVPTQGSVTLQLAVTDNLGDSDTANVTLSASGGSSSAAPASTSVPRGGGAADGVLLLVLGTLLARRATQRRTLLKHRLH
jgi:serine protease